MKACIWKVQANHIILLLCYPLKVLCLPISFSATVCLFLSLSFSSFYLPLLVHLVFRDSVSRTALPVALRLVVVIFTLQFFHTPSDCLQGSFCFVLTRPVTVCVALFDLFSHVSVCICVSVLGMTRPYHDALLVIYAKTSLPPC